MVGNPSCSFVNHRKFGCMGEKGKGGVGWGGGGDKCQGCRVDKVKGNALHR